jgi:hypothetical protein
MIELRLSIYLLVFVSSSGLQSIFLSSIALVAWEAERRKERVCFHLRMFS